MFGRRRGRKFPPGVLLSFLALVAILLLLLEGLLMADRKIRPAILDAAVMECDGIATRAINRVLYEKVVPTVDYGNLIIIEKDDGGKVVMARINTAEINRIMSLTTVATGDAVTGISEREIKVPLGAVTGSYILASRGPKIPVRMKPMGRVNTVLHDSFEDAGINQTRHKIHVEVITEVQIIIPLIADSIEVFTMVPLAEAIYIGEVPETICNLYFPGDR